MAASVNKVLIIGFLGRDPDVKSLNDGATITNITIATTDSWKDKATGEKKEATEWHRVVFFGKLAEIAGQYLKKGRQVYIEGALRTRKWTDKDGQERYTTEIVANEMKMLGSREGAGSNDQPARTSSGARATGGGGDARPNNAGGQSAQAGHGFDGFEDDIPFTKNGMFADPMFKRLRHKE